ncbi:MAG: hypothetical protein IT270_13770 [Saprospiraceae bacterium]|nr:hypothetical protein [Saprospiraceae bacterium]
MQDRVQFIMNNLNEKSVSDAQTAALAWLERSMEVTNFEGSAHSYSPIFGWKNAYPETTGYLIETMWDQKNDVWNNHARRCTQWLLQQQLPSGAFPGRTVGYNQPSVFNTTQILFGLARSFREISPDENPDDPWNLRNCCAHSAVGAVTWLLDILETDGAWRQAAYVPGFVPTYYTRAVWGVLKASDLPGMPNVQEPMQRALTFYTQRLLPDGTLLDAGFQSGKPAFTHTIAYALEGFWECALIFNDETLLKRVETALKRMSDSYKKHGKMAGRYTQDWQGDFSFACPTGQVQLSALLQRMGEPWQDFGLQLLSDTLPHQNRGNNKNTHGALPGSVPIWGPYMRFRYPNWGVKFLLDALSGYTANSFSII